MNAQTKKIKKARITYDGYCRIDLHTGEGTRRKKSYQVHRMVAITFIANPNNLETVNHIDENKQNNKVENLEWMSRSDNNRYGTAHLRQAIARMTHGKYSKLAINYLKENQL